MGRTGPSDYLPDCDTCHFSLTSAPTSAVTDPRHYYKSWNGDPMGNVDALALATRLPGHTKWPFGQCHVGEWVAGPGEC